MMCRCCNCLSFRFNSVVWSAPRKYHGGEVGASNTMHGNATISSIFLATDIVTRT